jgi:protocatechuate 3,4-dioxygenase beta subunit
MRPRAAPLIAVACLTCAATWLALAAAAPKAPDREHDVAVAGDSPAAPELAAPSPRSAPRPAAQAALAGRPPPAGSAPARLLRVRVLCDDPAVPPVAEILVFGGHRKGWVHTPHLEASPAADGVAVIDVGPLLEEAPYIHALSVGAVHPECARVNASVAIPGADGFGTGDVPARFTLDMEIRLTQACVLEGLVLDPDGRPVADCPVQALRREDTPAEGTRTFGVGVLTDADGRFRFPAVGEGDALVAAAKRGFRPGSVPAVVTPGVARDVGTIRLERGATFAGWIRCGGVPSERTTVIATWYGTRKTGTRPAGAALLWVEDGRVLWSQLEMHPDDDGRFRFDGLEPGPYRLRVPTEDWGCALHPDAYAEVDFLTRAPDERLDIDAHRSQLVIEVTDGEKLVQHAHVTLDGRDRIRLDSNTNGEVGVVLRSGRRHRATIEAPGFALAAIEVTSAGPGERRRERVTLSAASTEDFRGLTRYVGRRNRLYAPFRLNIVGPDGLPAAASCRILDSEGTQVACELLDVRTVVEISSADRTAVGGLTAIVGVPPRGVVVLGGGGFEEARWSAGSGAPDGEGAPPVVLRAR